ncbi:unnamed protein product [Cunninghamella blakesleeana]
MSKVVTKISPTRAFFNCPESQRPLRYGFVVFKYQEDAKKAFNERFIKVPPGIFKDSCEIKIEASSSTS